MKDIICNIEVKSEDIDYLECLVRKELLELQGMSFNPAYAEATERVRRLLRAITTSQF